MADKKKDATDLMLESLFASDAVPDNGFSERIEKRVRRDIWVRRLTLPIAATIGGVIAIKPLAGLIKALLGFVGSQLPTSIGTEIEGLAASTLPSTPTIVLAAVLGVSILVLSRVLEEFA